KATPGKRPQELVRAYLRGTLNDAELRAAVRLAMGDAADAAAAGEPALQQAYDEFLSVVGRALFPPRAPLEGHQVPASGTVELRPRVEHWHLLQLVRRLPQDYPPFGLQERDDPATQTWHHDCSSGCLWYRPLAGPQQSDWGTCCNPASHRAGLLTFEHQGCAHFEAPPPHRRSRRRRARP